MSFENPYITKEVKPSSHEMEQEIEPSLVKIKQDIERLAHGNVEIDHLLDELPRDDIVIKAAAERSKSIRERINVVLQRSLLLLSISATTTIVNAQEDVSIESENVRPHVELEYNNPQRLASENARTYKSFLRAEIKKYQSFIKERVNLNEVTDIENVVETIQSGRILDKKQIELMTRVYSKKIAETYLESLQDERDDVSSYAQQNREAYKEMDHARQWLADLVHSDEYLKRARAEGLSDEEIQERQRRSLQDNTQFIDEFYEDNLAGYYVPAGSEMYPKSEHDQIRIARTMSDSVPEMQAIQAHEVAHRITRGEEGLSEQAKNLYKEAFKGDLIIEGPKIASFAAIKYLSDPTELDARKKSFEYQLEKLTNWRYGQPFTPEILEQVRQLESEGKFSEDVKQFLKVIKPEYLERIMNELVDINDLDDSKNIV